MSWCLHTELETEVQQTGKLETIRITVQCIRQVTLCFADIDECAHQLVQHKAVSGLN